MAKTKVVVDSGRTVFTGLKYMYITPWVEEGEGATGLKLSDTTYEVVNIVGDSTSIEQEDNDVQEVEHEFSSTPLYEAVTLGKKTFTAECADYQEDVLVNLFGWSAGTEETTGESVIQYAPTGYKEFYAAIELGFNSSKKVVVLPKVRLDSKVALASMKTDISRATITGSCYEAYVSIEDKEYKSDMFTTTARLIPPAATDDEPAPKAYTLSEKTTKQS